MCMYACMYPQGEHNIGIYVIKKYQPLHLCYPWHLVHVARTEHLLELNTCWNRGHNILYHEDIVYYKPYLLHFLYK